MILRNASDFLAQGFGDDQHGSLTADRFMLVSPDEFKVGGCDDNRFAHGADTVIRTKAKYQHERISLMLSSLEKEVKVFPGKSPDDVFPNNVFATNKSRQLIVGNMANEVRKSEANRGDIISWFRGDGFEVKKMSSFTQQAAELTGSLIIDHQKNIGFCGLSGRCHEDALEPMRDAFGLNAIYAFPINIYHTNVGMSVLAGRFCVLCPDMFERREDAEAILKFYPDHLVLEEEQMNRFVGNIIAVREDIVAISQTAYFGLRDEGRKLLNKSGFSLTFTDISELEKSGGSIRCAIMEIFDEQRSSSQRLKRAS